MSGQLIDIAPDQLRAAMEAGEVLLVDVREPAEFAVARIHGAVNHPLSTFDPRALLSEANPRHVILQCGSGKRSAMAAARCQAAGFDVDKHLAGGIQAWATAGLPLIDINAATGQLRDPG